MELLPVFDGSAVAWIVAGLLLLLASVGIIVAWRLQWLLLQMASTLSVCLVVLWTSMPTMALAQDQLGAAARELIDHAEARARTAEEALTSWLQQSTRISDAHREEIRVMTEENAARIAEGMKIVSADDSSFGDAARLITEAEDEGGALYIAVSLTMPKEALRQLSIDAEKAGARMVIRGLVDGSFERTLVVAREVFGQDDLSGLAIEPQVFRAYGVERVPTFIAATSPVQPCEDGVDCVSSVTPHDRIAGNISLAEALRQISQRGDAAPDVARAALTRLEG